MKKRHVMWRRRARFPRWHGHCDRTVRGKWSPREEVGTMAYLAMGIAFVVLEIIAAVKTRTGHA